VTCLFQPGSKYPEMRCIMHGTCIGDTASRTIRRWEEGWGVVLIYFGKEGVGWGPAKAHDEPLSSRENTRINSIGNGNTIVDCLSLAIVVRVVR